MREGIFEAGTSSRGKQTRQSGGKAVGEVRDRLIELEKQATTLYFDYLESIDQKGLIDTEGRAKFIADHLIAHGVTVNEWRPASEPPKNGNERVAVFLKDDSITAAIGNNRIDTDRYLNGGWVRWGRFVTHWMPLPQPPKEVE